MEINKLSSHLWIQFKKDYFLGKYPNERLGQAFLNKFKQFDELNQDAWGFELYGKLFNAMEGFAIQMIEQHLVRW